MLRVPARRERAAAGTAGAEETGLRRGQDHGPGRRDRAGETDAACAVREAREEAGIAVDPDGLAWRAEIGFVFPSRPDLDAVATVFFGER